MSLCVPLGLGIGDYRRKGVGLTPSTSEDLGSTAGVSKSASEDFGITAGSYEGVMVKTGACLVMKNGIRLTARVRGGWDIARDAFGGHTGTARMVMPALASG